MATGESSTKRCWRCNAEKPLTDFYRDSRAKDGCQGSCKPCGRAAAARYASENHERVLESYAKRRRSKADEIRESKKTTYYADIELARAKSRASVARWRAKHPEKVRANNAKWHAENPDKARAKSLKQRTEHPEQYRASSARRRATKIGAQVGCRKAYARFLKRMRDASAIDCYWCKKTTGRGDRHLDHVIPLARGGADSVANLCVSCRRCNQRKHAKLPEEFVGQGEFRLA